MKKVPCTLKKLTDQLLIISDVTAIITLVQLFK